nr:hypothetical protein [Neobacillus sp. Marseille-Q6967]
MYLAFKDVRAQFEDFKGVEENEHLYYTVSNNAVVPQPRGLFVPLNDSSGELLDAIANGAIATVWDKGKKLPHYTPNHFPVFFTDDPAGSVRKILALYLEKLDGDNVKKMNMTKFVFLNKELLKENKETYDIAVMLEKLASKTLNSEGRE